MLCPSESLMLADAAWNAVACIREDFRVQKATMIPGIVSFAQSSGLAILDVFIVTITSLSSGNASCRDVVA